MYTDYTRLWKLLHDKGLTKIYLCRATGISTRTLAKLVANRSVTTDTLLAICETLDCDVCDIMEFTREAPARTLFEVYREHAKRAVEEGALRITEFEHMGTRFKIGTTAENANRHTVIHCRPTGVSWEQIHAVGISPLSEIRTVCGVSFLEKDKVCIVLIGGAPGNITGLDEGIYLSAKREYGEGKLYVMSTAAFKLFRTAAKA